MNNSRVISTKQVGRLLLGYTLGASLLVMPSGMARIFGPGAWLVTLTFGMIFVVGGWLTARLVEKYPEETIVEFGPKLLGKILGFIFNIILALFFLSVVPYQTRAMVELVNIAIIPNGPAWFISAFFLFTVVYGVIKGLDTFVQMNEFLIIISVIIGIAVVLLGWENINVVHLLPLFYYRDLHMKSTIDILALSFSFFGYPIIFYIAPFLKKPGKMTGFTVRTLIFITIIYSFLVLTVVGVFGVKEAGSQGWPVLELAKSIHLPGSILERMDLVIILSWIPAIYTTATGSLFFGVEGLARMFHLKKRSSLAWSLALVFFFVSSMIGNYFQWVRWGNLMAIAGLLLSLILPILLWLAYLIRPGRRGDSPE